MVIVIELIFPQILSAFQDITVISIQKKKDSFIEQVWETLGYINEV